MRSGRGQGLRVQSCVQGCEDRSCLCSWGSFRFDEDSTETENAEQNPTVGGALELVSNPRTSTSWLMNPGCSLIIYLFDSLIQAGRFWKSV